MSVEATTSKPRPGRETARPDAAARTAAAASEGRPSDAVASSSRRTVRQRAPPSDAKRRMEHLATGVDQRLAVVVGLLVVVFVVSSLVAFGRIPNVDDESGRLFFEDQGSPSAAVHSGPGPVLAKSPRRHQQLFNGLPPQYESYTDIKDVRVLQRTFPVHVGRDTEEIDHPGVLLSTGSQRQTRRNVPPTMTVPQFWRPTAYHPRGVRFFLGEHGSHLITPRQAEQIGSFAQVPGAAEPVETVYVSIASYRDYECRPTLEDLFERAKHPERIRVAVIDQRTDSDDFCTEPRLPCAQDPTQTLCKYGSLIDIYQVDARLSVGPVFARHLANRMYRGEYFAMQIDSHVRFTEHWDEDLIGQWKSANNEMAVLTTYLSDITDSIDPVSHKNRHPARPIMCQTGYEGSGKMRHLRHGQQPEGIPYIHNEPTLHPFWAAGFSFARGHFVVQVPYDQYLPMVFQGEEISIGLRGFTYGYDYYTAERSVAFHMYAVKANKEKRQRVKLFWENKNLYPGSGLKGMKRLNGIIGMGDPEDDYYHKDEQEYGLGQVRPRDQFFRLYGIHPETKTVEGHLCRFVGQPMQRKFLPYLRADRMGIDFSKIDYEYKDPNPKKKR